MQAQSPRWHSDIPMITSQDVDGSDGSSQPSPDQSLPELGGFESVHPSMSAPGNEHSVSAVSSNTSVESNASLGSSGVAVMQQSGSKGKAVHHQGMFLTDVSDTMYCSVCGSVLAACHCGATSTDSAGEVPAAGNGSLSTANTSRQLTELTRLKSCPIAGVESLENAADTSDGNSTSAVAVAIPPRRQWNKIEVCCACLQHLFLPASAPFNSGLFQQFQGYIYPVSTSHI